MAERYGGYALSGDSAGGGLAAATALRLAGSHAAPSRLGLISPWVDLSVVPPASKADIVVRPAWGQASVAAYCGPHDRFDPGISPIFGDLSGLPTTLVQVGRDEVLREQCERFVQQASRAGADISLTVLPRLWHVAHLQADLLPEAYDVLVDLGRFLAGEPAA